MSSLSEPPTSAEHASAHPAATVHEVAPHRRSRHERALQVLGVSGVLSILFLGAVGVAALLEFSQLFIRARTASMSDVWALGFGGVVGALVWTAAGPSACDRATRVLAGADATRRATLALAAYALLWIAVGLLPLAFPKYAFEINGLFVAAMGAVLAWSWRADVSLGGTGGDAASPRTAQ